MAHSSNQSTLNILAPRNGLILTFGDKTQIGVSNQTALIYTRATYSITIVRNIAHSLEEWATIEF